MTYDPSYKRALSADKATMYYDPLNKMVSQTALISNAYGSMYVVAPPNIVTIETIKNPIEDKVDIFRKNFRETRNNLKNSKYFKGIK